MSRPSPYPAIQWARRQRRITNPVARNVLNAIAMHADSAGACWPSQEELAELTADSERAARMALKWLENEGSLHREERRRRNGSRTSASRNRHLGAEQPESHVTPTGIRFRAHFVRRAKGRVAEEPFRS
ncbi:helix-turn-helix domain-containing protein [Methylobacterium sp. ID0610]|uniref:helix-turn-helix domain-containing protein n=1 Tax=Methylobacterium carpenticola TaxID=3344827 RepID=UPI0036BF5755